jgi:hypothetical protein
MNTQPNSIANEPKRVSLTQFVGYFSWLGTVGFGGPIAFAGHMQQDLVDGHGWIRKEDYLEVWRWRSLHRTLSRLNSRFISATFVRAFLVLPP